MKTNKKNTNLVLTKEEIEKDSEVLGGIIAGAQKKPLKVKVSGAERKSSVCAVGAGNIGRKVNKSSDIAPLDFVPLKHELQPAKRFANAYKVSMDYVCGVNDGFEDNMGAARTCFHPKVDMGSRDYLRGWSVGQTASIYKEPNPT